jgi:hypothetical protein
MVKPGDWVQLLRRYDNCDIWARPCPDLLSRSGVPPGRTSVIVPGTWVLYIAIHTVQQSLTDYYLVLWGNRPVWVSSDDALLWENDYA